MGISSSLLSAVKLATPESCCSGPVGPANLLALDSSSRDTTRDAETITGIFVAVQKCVHFSWHYYYGVFLLLSPQTRWLHRAVTATVLRDAIKWTFSVWVIK